MRERSEYFPEFSYSKHLQAINHYLFVTITKPLSNKIRETACDGFKLMRKLFEADEQRDY